MEEESIMAKSRARRNGTGRNREHAHALSADAVRERVEHRRSNAAGKHADRRTRRKRTRSAKQGSAIREQF